MTQSVPVIQLPQDNQPPQMTKLAKLSKLPKIFYIILSSRKHENILVQWFIVYLRFIYSKYALLGWFLPGTPYRHMGR